MAILGTELHWYQSKVVNDTSSNGGRISTTTIPSGQSNTWWPNISEAQLASGATHYRKSFIRVDNANDEVGYNLRVGLWKPTPGSDELYLFAGTQTDLQSNISSPDLYGAGSLDSSVLAGVSEIDVLVEDGSVTIFRAGDLIRISDQTTVGGSGNAEFKVIDTGGVSVVGDVVTLTLTSALANDYSSTNTTVSSMLEMAEVTGSAGSKVVTSASGTFDETQVVVGNLGSLYQTVTLTFTSATAFTATSDEVTFASPNGTINSTFAPTNISVGASYFSIPPAVWGGTYTNGDTVVFVTTPPAMPIWEKRVVPVGAAAIAAQTRTIMAFIES
jgi:hypothetical protein